MTNHPPRHARVRKLHGEWTTTYTGGPFAPMTLAWDSHKRALTQALIWVGLREDRSR